MNERELISIYWSKMLKAGMGARNLGVCAGNAAVSYQQARRAAHYGSLLLVEMNKYMVCYTNAFSEATEVGCANRAAANRIAWVLIAAGFNNVACWQVR